MTLKLLNQSIITCSSCPLQKTRQNAVPGEGPDSAILFMLGQPPGEAEDEANQLFVGPSGKILDNLLEHAGITTDTIYLTNLIKCKLPKARRPSRIVGDRRRRSFRPHCHRNKVRRPRERRRRRVRTDVSHRSYAKVLASWLPRLPFDSLRWTSSVTPTTTLSWGTLRANRVDARMLADRRCR